MERGDSGGVLRVTYRLAGTAKSCRFAAVSLSRDETKRHDSDWQIVGYGSEQRFLEDKASGYTMHAPDMMFCTVAREHQAPLVSR